MSGERDVEYLLKLYEQEYVKGEKRSRNYEQKIRYESKRKNRHLILNTLLIEAKPLTLTPNQIKVTRYLIDDFNEDFNQLHRQASEETIILAFIFYMKKVEKASIRLKDYKITSKYGLTNHIFELILCRMLLKFMKRCPIRPTINYTRDHDGLSRSGKR